MERKYPVGIQTFSEIIKGRCVYVDKTDLVWQLSHYAKYIFLSRPRRFGKSLLTSTLESYFKGEKQLFEGLKIMELEKEWQQYPVIRLSLSTAKGQDSPAELRDKLALLMKPYKEEYGSDPDEKTPGGIFAGIIRRAYKKAGKQVVVLLDEYDAPLLEVLHEKEMLAPMRKVMQEFYQTLKDSEEMIKFCFITGITKFSQLSIFSTINNLLNVTLDPAFAAICGITEKELTTTLRPDIERLAEKYNLNYEGMHEKLKLQYDGYHFTEESEGVYNPYSLMKAFLQRKVASYWFESGTPTFLIQQMQHFRTDIMSLDRMEVFSSEFDQPTEAMESALPLLYQSGYLTIKDYDEETETYTLSIPNQEVRIGYVEGLLPVYTGLEAGRVKAGFTMKFWLALKRHDVDLAMREMRAYLASIPYVEGFKKKLEDIATSEGFYEYTMYLIFSTLNFYVRTQVKCAGGRVDMVVWMPDATYVFELKVNGTAGEALEQIDSKDYALPYQTDGRTVVKVGVQFDAETRVPVDWVIS
ncbi:MAG: ATP-binding protein [Prevotella sp.]|nr:ATP-binding protein [Prevotella sp.]